MQKWAQSYRRLEMASTLRTRWLLFLHNSGQQLKLPLSKPLLTLFHLRSSPVERKLLLKQRKSSSSEYGYCGSRGYAEDCWALYRIRYILNWMWTRQLTSVAHISKTTRSILIFIYYMKCNFFSIRDSWVCWIIVRPFVIKNKLWLVRTEILFYPPKYLDIYRG